MRYRKIFLYVLQGFPVLFYCGIASHILLLACSVVMFLTDMSGRYPLYKKYVHNGPWTVVISHILFLKTLLMKYKIQMKILLMWLSSFYIV